MRDHLPRRIRAQLALSALNFLAGPDWHVFASDKGRLWATTSRRLVTGRVGGYTVACYAPDAIDADSAPEMAAKLRKRLGSEHQSGLDAKAGRSRIGDHGRP